MLTVHNLTCSAGSRVLWHAKSLKIRNQDRIALTGPSGSGKTLFLRILSGLDATGKGSITFKNRNLEDWDLPVYRRHVRYLPQDAAFLPGSLAQNLERFYSFRVYRDLPADPGIPVRMLEKMGLGESFLRKETQHLSGGEKQMGALIRTLLLQPNILLLDEPTSNMDHKMALRAEELILDWVHEQKDRAFVWTSHDRLQLDRLTGKSFVFEPGEKGTELKTSTTAE